MELLAAYFSIRHFRIMLEGHNFQLWMDHKPLLAALNHISEPWTPRQQQQLSFITECTDDIKHVPGHSNMVTYCLSRPLVAPVCQVAAHQQPTTPMYQVAPNHLEAGPDAPVTPLAIDYAAIAPTK